MRRSKINMFNFRIVDSKGFVTVIRARTKAAAVKLFCESEMCSKAYVDNHCVVRCVVQ